MAGNDALEGTPQIEFGKYKARLAHQLLRGFHLFPYGVPNLRVEVNTMKTFVPCSTWRSTGTYANVFYLESFIEEMAHAAGKDPIEYRRALISRASPASFEDNAKTDWLKLSTLLPKRQDGVGNCPGAPASDLPSTIGSPLRRGESPWSRWE